MPIQPAPTSPQDPLVDAARADAQPHAPAPAATAPANPLPPIWSVLPWHTLALICLQSTQTAMGFLLPIISKKQFSDDDFKTTIITAAPTVLAIVSIFWGAMFARTRMTQYALMYWLVASVPLALAHFAQSYWMLATLTIIGAIGAAGWTPVAGYLLRRFYPEAVRGKIYGRLYAAVMLAGALASYGLGQWLKHDPAAFRTYMPIGAALQGAGLLILIVLTRRGAVPDASTSGRRTTMQSVRHQVARLRDPLGAGASMYESAIRPILHMGEVLKADKIFARYEAAFMTYGVGWMISWSLLPLMLTDKFKLNYDQATQSSNMPMLIATVVATAPAGLMIDRLGAMRTCMIAFGIYLLYPLGLIFASGTLSLTMASVIFGVCSAMVNMGWMLGPVSLAPTPEKVPQYIAIHTTLVGFRGAVFQAGAVLLYKATSSFTIPLIVAALAFAWASYQMWALHHLAKAQRAKMM